MQIKGKRAYHFYLLVGDDLLSMKEKEKLVKRINEVKNNKQIIQEWMAL